MKLSTTTSGLAALHWSFAALVEQARGQLSEREFEAWLDLVTRRMAGESARVLPARLRSAA
jgi:hypothetical protein